jgi:hypothetical protein
MKSTRTIIFMLFIIQNVAVGQSFDLGSWNIVNLKYNFNNTWSTFGEAQLRSLQFYDDFHYYEYKAGVNYKFHKNALVSLGAGSYQTYKEGGNFISPKNNNEFRLWPQLILFQSLGEFKIEQRYRTELRFTSNGYRNRFRYRVGISYPFGATKATFKPFIISVSNELFFTNNEPYFERNRALVALSYKPSKSTTLQIGYLHQFDYKTNDETGRDFLQLGYFIEIFKKEVQTTEQQIELHDN